MQKDTGTKGWRIAIVTCGTIALIGLWITAIHVSYKDHQRTIQEESIVHPGAVAYGTHSKVSLPVIDMRPRRSGAPMISATTIRHYAYAGHAQTPAVEASRQAIHTTSSATVRTIGSGIGGSVAMAGVTSSASTRGIQYATPSVTMPSLAWASTSIRNEQGLSSPAAAPGLRRAKPLYTGEDGDWINGGSGDWWYYDEDHWRNPYDGETRYDPTLSYTVIWNGSEWVKLTEYDPGVPVGDAPWWCLFLLVAAYILVKKADVKKLLCGLILLCAITVSAQQQEVIERNTQQGFNDTIDRLAPDFVKVSLVVCDPDEVLYSTLGHAALHLQCPTFDLDYVFSYESENVRDKIWTFLKGNLKMGMFALPTDEFLETYRERGRGVREYTLNMSPEQKQKLWQVMDRHVEEGANIPYDYFHRGCAKSIVHVMHEAVGKNTIHYAPWSEKYTKQTQREIVRNFIEGAPWEEFFMYFLIGSEGDKPCPCEQKLIVPTDLVEVWQTATLTGKEPLLDSTPHVLLEATRHNEGTWCTPLLVSILLFLLAFTGWKAVDYGLLAVYSLIGIMMTYLICFSGLPCTNWNWLIIPFNILPLLVWPWRRYWAIVYAVILFIWCAVMSGELLFGHVLVDWAHILLVLSLMVVLLKQCRFANCKKQN